MGSSDSKPAAPTSYSPEAREEIAADMSKTLNAVAAQVYDNVHSQLGDLQTAQLDKTLKMAGEIKQRLAPAANFAGQSDICKAENLKLVECLKANKDSPLNCDAIVDSLTRCANASVVNAK